MIKSIEQEATKITTNINRDRTTSESEFNRFPGFVFHRDTYIKMTLATYLTSFLSYDSQWGIWAERIDGKFELESKARFGQFIFENGGLLDEFQCVGNNESITDIRDEYCGTDEGCEDFYEEWAIEFIQTLNEEEEN